jgi:hypothetical protein
MSILQESLLSRTTKELQVPDSIDLTTVASDILKDLFYCNPPFPKKKKKKKIIIGLS